jgi:hypothetical protein
VDGLFHRYSGFGLVLAASANEARTTATDYLKHATAYAKPYDDDVDPLEPGVPQAVGPRRFTAPDGQVFFGQRRGRLFVFWPAGDEDNRDEAYCDPNDPKFALVALASTLGFQIGRHEFPSWLGALEAQVVHDLWGDDRTP